MDDTKQLPKTRKEAIEAGETHYLKETPCKRGHFAPRSVIDTRCNLCDLEYYKSKYQQNTEYHRRKNAEWRAANPDYRKAYCAKNPVKTFCISFKNRYKDQCDHWDEQHWEAFEGLVREKLRLQSEGRGTWRLVRQVNADLLYPEDFDLVPPGGKKSTIDR